MTTESMIYYHLGNIAQKVQRKEKWTKGLAVNA